jgi:orotate phosphoribosyltransferase
MPSIEFSRRLKETEALLEGHFQLSSGLHSNRYFQCARLLQHPGEAEWACRTLARLVQEPVDAVIGPALGGVIVAHEMGRALGVRALFAERVEGKMRLRRGFGLAPGERVLVVEDVVTTGLSAREVAELVHSLGAKVTAFASLVDRSGGLDMSPFHSLLTVTVESHPPEECPLCKEGIPIDQPGSRWTPCQER